MNILTQAALYWTLLGLLLVWMVICAILAFRPEPGKHTLREEAHAPANAHSYVATPAMLQAMTPQSIAVPAHAGTASADSSQGFGL